MKRGYITTLPSQKWQVRRKGGEGCSINAKTCLSARKVFATIFLTLGEFYNSIFYTINVQSMRLTPSSWYDRQKPSIETKDGICPSEMSFSSMTLGVIPWLWQRIHWKEEIGWETLEPWLVPLWIVLVRGYQEILGGKATVQMASNSLSNFLWPRNTETFKLVCRSHTGDYTISPRRLSKSCKSYYGLWLSTRYQ